MNNFLKKRLEQNGGFSNAELATIRKLARIALAKHEKGEEKMPLYREKNVREIVRILN